MSKPTLLDILNERTDRCGVIETLEKKLEPGKRGARARVVMTGPREADLSFVAARIHARRAAAAPTLLLANKLEPTLRHYDDLLFFGLPNVQHYPSWETLPFEHEKLNLEVMAKRLDTLAALAGIHARGAAPAAPPIVVAPIDALLQKTVSPEWLRKVCVRVEWGETLDLAAFAESLARIGYHETPMVEARGEFSVRGGIVDVFSLHADNPVRLDLFGTEIESIRPFDLSTQRSVTKETIEQVVFLPADEMQMVRAALADGAGLVPLLDYFPAESLVVEDGNDAFAEAVDKFHELVVHEHQLIEEGKFAWEDPTGAGRSAPAVADYFLAPAALTAALCGFAKIVAPRLGVDDPAQAEAAHAAGMLMRDASVNARGFGNIEPSLETYIGVIRARQHEDYLVAIVCDNEGQAMRFEEILAHAEIGSLRIGAPDTPEPRLHLRGPLEGYPEVILCVGSLSCGFVLPEAHLILITDREVFGRYKRRHVYRKLHKGVAIKAVDEIQRGDYVVHIEHGIGCFLGIRRQEIDGETRDLIEIDYAGGDKLLVPVDKVRLVQKFAAHDNAAPALDKLGGKRWQARKTKSSEQVELLARELLDLYAEREAAGGIAHDPDNHLQGEFEASFLYQETPDQLEAILAVKRDMENDRPMDRLVCGDVGFGKTEVAIRAAFKTIQGGRQVALLCPTTILAQQHFLNFRERFADYPIRVEQLSRFQSPKEIKETLARLKSGECQLVIGTHRLLGKDVRFAELGLIVIDEEQRFGVAHKERLKKLRTEVDVLTLTATPIPRTLYMALSGLRDMSLISTPPADRYPVRTRVISFNKEQIEEAILREMNRGGQVYFVHNRVHNIDEIRERLLEIVPKARIAIAHGQMDEHDLEEVMLQFIDGKFDILLATTIIENGLDITNCNTIIINRADAFGLAQLYQLRGRVGRSTRRAYSYLIVPDGQPITDTAVKRLEAIQEFTELGEGFNVAMRDMQIRGTGNILGAQQHGTMEAVGFELYCEMLETAVRRLRGEGVGEGPVDVEIAWRASAFIPPEYIPIESQRFSFYKRVAAVRRESEIDALDDELRDRFGQLPESVDNILKIARLRVLGGQAGARRIAMTTDGFKMQVVGDELAALTIWNRLAADHPGVDGVGWLNDGHIGVKVKNWGKGRRLEKSAKLLAAYVALIEADMQQAAEKQAKRREAAVAARE